MVIAAKLTYDKNQITKLQAKISKRLPDEMNNAVYSYAKKIKEGLKANALIDPLRPITADRQRAAALIMAKKQSKNTSVVTMPKSLIYLDSMSPHYVSLKRGRNIANWARRNYGNAQVSGRSHVIKGPRGGLSGQMFVTPHRFVQRTLHEKRKILPNELRKGITKAFTASA